MSLKTRLVSMFGRLSYERPEWMKKKAEAPQGPGFFKRFGPALLALLVLGGGGYGTFYWYKHRPPPPDKLLLTATVNTPTPPPRTLRNEPVPPPSELQVQFNASAAPLEQINKPVTQFVSLSPALKGEWKWASERTLSFSPDEAWPVGKKFTVRLDPKLVARSNVVLQTHELEFETHPFVARLEQVDFYQDPVDPQVKQVTATFEFNYPIDEASFEKLVSLTSHRSEERRVG